MMAEESPMLPDQGSHTMTHVANNSAAAGFVFDNTYARELEGSYVTWKAAPVARPRLVKLNRELAEELGLDAGALDSEEGARIFAGSEIPEGAALPGAVLTRVAASHIRVGTFQFFAARGEQAKVHRLADYAIDRHYPELKGDANPYLGLLERVRDKQAALIASWMHVGFIHGVMNTDNMAISGETIDYGPCAFMDHSNPATVFSSIDTYGRS